MYDKELKMVLMKATCGTLFLLSIPNGMLAVVGDNLVICILGALASLLSIIIGILVASHIKHINNHAQFQADIAKSLDKKFESVVSEKTCEARVDGLHSKMDLICSKLGCTTDG